MVSNGCPCVGGRLLLKRGAPDVCIINPDSILPDLKAIESICPGYWSGDLISVDCFPLGDSPFPPQTDSYATYFGSRFFLGPNRDHIDSNNDQFYKNDNEDFPDGQFGDDADFYAKPGDISEAKRSFRANQRIYTSTLMSWGVSVSIKQNARHWLVA